MFQVWSFEVLDPAIITIRDDYLLVLAVKCDAPWVGELATRLACLRFAKQRFEIQFPLSEFLI